MSRTATGLAGLLIAGAWYLGAAPSAYEFLITLRDPAALAASGSTASGTQVEPTRAEQAESERLHQLSEAWSPRAAALLTAEQRRRGRELAEARRGARPEAPHRLLAVEGDLWVLATALIQAHGARLGITPSVPAEDPWGGLARRDRVLALVALTREGALEPEQAAGLLTLTLEAMQAQAAQKDLGLGLSPMPSVLSLPEAEPLR